MRRIPTSRPLAAAGLLAALLASPGLSADQIEVSLSLEHEPGFSTIYDSDDHESMQQNIQAQVSAYRFEGVDRLSPQRIHDLAENAREQAAEALRPFGYYHATVNSQLRESDTPGRWLLALDVNSGPPVRVDEVHLRINGEGRDDPVLREWLDDWPLPRGAVLDQRAWRAAKNQGLELAGTQGYLQSGYPTRKIELDLPARTARIELTMNTGERAVMGEVRYPELDLDPRLLGNMPRFEPGEPYRERLVTLLREDLVKSGWFDQIEIREEPHLDATPPRVDLDVSLRLRPPNTWQTTVGFGTDTGPRMGFNWRRHLWSERGDSWHAGVGARESDREFVLFGEYRRPMLDRPLDAWTASARIRFERDQVRFLDEDDGEPLLPAVDGDRQELQLRLGRQSLKYLFGDRDPVFETIFVEPLVESFEVDRSDLAGPGFAEVSEQIPELAQSLDSDPFTLTAGVVYEWPVIYGRHFEIEGHHEILRFQFADDALASDVSFAQLYFSTRWEKLLSDNWKLISRGEVGYTDAPVDEFEVENEQGRIKLSLTELPSAYRFRAGGDRSVRGYGFEDLSNNRWGSNNLLTASVEIERRVLEDWSGALFVDAGNAFNDTSDPDLKVGIGFGVRWYTVIGPVKLDFAKALDKAGEPWSIHFTIGSILL